MQYIDGSKNKLRTRVKPFAKDVREALLPTVDSIRGTLLRSARSDERIDPRDKEQIQVQVGDAIQRGFVGPNLRSPFGQDGVTPLAPYPRLLNKWYATVVIEAINVHHNWMKRHVPTDVFEWLSNQQTPSDNLIIGENEFLRRPDEPYEVFLSRMDDLRVFRPNPLAVLDPKRRWVPMHRWNTPDGYRLSDRVWETSVHARTQIDKVVGQGIREGWSALRISRAVEQYLLPAELRRITRKPYGSRAIYSAMRLGRTEVARAANHAAYTAAYLNPYVNQIDVARSTAGDPTCPICPQHATIGLGGGRLREPYSITSADLPVYHPHCMCHVRPIAESPAAVTARIRAVMGDAESIYLEPVLTPAARETFVSQMLGLAMMRILPQILQHPLI